MRRIVLDDLRGDAIAALLQEHMRDMRAWSPAGSVHALDLSKLRVPEISFWTLWDESILMGCGALKDLGHQQGEIKSMRTANAYRHQGVAAELLSHIINTAKQRGMTHLYLETGAQAQFAPARALYRGFGFQPCEAFADYTADPNSFFMSLYLHSSSQ